MLWKLTKGDYERIKYTSILYEHLIPFKKKIKNLNCKYINAVQNTFIQKAACKLFIK